MNNRNFFAFSLIVFQNFFIGLNVRKDFILQNITIYPQTIMRQWIEGHNIFTNCQSVKDLNKERFRFNLNLTVLID